jgi:hypothetical protein
VIDKIYSFEKEIKEAADNLVRAKPRLVRQSVDVDVINILEKM